MKGVITHAMILAAGFGTRLKPLTDSVPKALIPYRNKPMIEYVIARLLDSGINNITVNTHYLADKVREFFYTRDYGVRINITREDEILGTGGGIKNAAAYLAGSGDFLIHNVDVVSGIDVARLAEYHKANKAFATLAVKNRKTSRPLLADAAHNLCGRVVEGNDEIFVKKDNLTQTAFCGVYMLSDKIFELFPGDNKFEIIPFLLDMAGKNEKILCYDIGMAEWKDLGRLKDLEG